MTTVSARTTAPGVDARLRVGAALMALAGLGFVGYALLFFVRNFTDAFLELGIGRAEVGVGRSEIAAFSPAWRPTSATCTSR